MENKTPDYAKWIPESNGYVYQGQVVSNKPFTDSNGSMVEQVTMDVINRRNNSSDWNGVVSSTPLADYDVNSSPTASQTQVNQSGSNEDVNANITSIGSMGSFGENTEQSTTGVLDTNATKSPNVNIEPVDPMEKLQQDYAYMVSTNNIKGQIDALVGMSQIDGIDRTAQIEALNKRRNEKIKSQDDAYSERYMNAMLSGDQEEANKIAQEQNAYRNSVDYKTALADMKAEEQEKINIDYQFSYMQGVNDIVNYIGNLTGQLLNFQYNPAQDTSLQLAQSQAISRVKEQSAATGMYYSSMTQYAITKACAELVPVYEKMARDELKENIQLLQNTASFLMNLEESQFNMWKTQVSFQFEQKEQERKAVQDAWDRADYLGYIDNEASLVLGIPAGTLSAGTRKQILERNEQIAKEQRGLEIDLTLASYNEQLAEQKMREQERLDEKYWAYQVNNPKPTASSSSGVTYSQISTALNSMVNGGATAQDILDFVSNSNLTEDQKNTLLTKALYDLQNKGKEDEEGLNKDTPNVPKETRDLLDATDTEYNKELNTALAKDITQGSDFATTINKFISGYGEEKTALLMDSIINKYVQPTLDSKTSTFGSDGGKTKNAFKDTVTYIDGIADKIISSNLGNVLNNNQRGINSSKAEVITALYENLVDQIDRTSDFDYSVTDFWDDVADLKKKAKEDILKNIEKNKSYGGKQGDIYMQVEAYINGAGTNTRTVASSVENEVA